MDGLRFRASGFRTTQSRGGPLNTVLMAFDSGYLGFTVSRLGNIGVWRFQASNV